MYVYVYEIRDWTCASSMQIDKYSTTEMYPVHFYISKQGFSKRPGLDLNNSPMQTVLELQPLDSHTLIAGNVGLCHQTYKILPLCYVSWFQMVCLAVKNVSVRSNET